MATRVQSVQFSCLNSLRSDAFSSYRGHKKGVSADKSLKHTEVVMLEMPGAHQPL